MRVVVKVGSSSVTDESGDFNAAGLTGVAANIAALVESGHSVVLVSSGAISCGLGRLGAIARPSDRVQLRAAAALGQVVISSSYRALFDAYGLLSAQLLMIPSDFTDRRQYLFARETLTELLRVGAVPVINENDALSNEQLRYGDNDLLSALICNLVAADLLLLLTDQPGIYTADPRFSEEATLIEEISDLIDLNVDLGGSGSQWGSGGMASKLKAARMAAHSGVQTVIASAKEPDVVLRAVNGEQHLGTVVRPHGQKLPARKLWIAFAAPAVASVVVDFGARMAVERRGSSLLVAGVLGVEGVFSVGEVVTVCDREGQIFAKGIARRDSVEVEGLSSELGDEVLSDRRSSLRQLHRGGELIHRDDLVVLTR
jgi:glutamate 5-kinase